MATSTAKQQAGLRHCMLAAGVDYLHPDLGGGFGPGYRVITGYDFVGDEGPCQC